MDETLSRLVLAIYRLTRGAPTTHFRDAVLETVRDELSFDSGIAMHQAVLMSASKSVPQLHKNSRSLISRQWAASMNVFFERFALE